MFARVMCPGCKYQFSIPEGSMGKRQVCPNCQSPFIAGKTEPEGAVQQQSAQQQAAPQPGYAKTMLGDMGTAIKYNCPRCKAPLESPVSESGTKKPCPACGQRLQVPAPPPPAAASPAAPQRLDKTMLASDGNAAPPAPPIKYNCPNCKKPLESPASEAGIKKPCPACGQRLQVPAAPSGPNLSKTMLASDGSSVPQPAGGAAYASYTAPGSPAAPAPGAPAPAAPPMIAGVPVTGRNIAIAAGLLFLLLVVVPSLLRGGRVEDRAALAKAEKDLENIKAELDRRKLDLDQHKQSEANIRRELDGMAAKVRAQEDKMLFDQRQALLAITDQKLKSEMEFKFEAAQRKWERDKEEMAKSQQKLLEDAKTRLDESKRALEESRQKQQSVQTIIQQPPYHYYQPWHPGYYRPWGW